MTIGHRPRLRVLLPLLLVLALEMPGSVGSDAGAHASPPAQGVAGVVVDSIGAAVPGATVSAYASTTATTPVAQATTSTAGTYTLDLGTGTFYLRFSKHLYVTRWFNQRTSQSTATPVTVGSGIVVPAVNATLPDLKPTGGLSFFPSKVPIVIETRQVHAESVRIDALDNVNGCACITFADGTTASTINGKQIYKISFTGFRPVAPVKIGADAPDYRLTGSDPSGRVIIGGTSASGQPMITEVYGTLDSISLTSLCLVNWAWAAGLGDLLNFGIDATAYCAKFTAYAARAAHPHPNPYDNPLLLPDVNLLVESQ